MKTSPLPHIAPASTERSQLKIVIVGHVDHGKSSLVGRIFHDTGSLPDGKYDAIKKMCDKRGMPFEYSFLMDALQAERDQGITIDTTQIWFKTPKRDYVIIDAPGHKEFLKNMISGAASSEAAVLVIDAKEGVREQSKRHGYLLHLLGVQQIAVAVNKMDLVDYSEARFKEIEKEFTAYLKDIGVTPSYIIPISAREGDLITSKSAHMPWYTGPSVVEALDLFTESKKLDELPLRFPVQDVYKFDERRIIAGRIEAGSLKVGDELLFSPTNKTARIASIEHWPENDNGSTKAAAGESVGITLDEQIFVERGNVISHRTEAPKLTNIFKAKLFWLGKQPLAVGKRYKLKIATSEWVAEVKEIDNVVNTDDLSHSSQKQVERGAVAEVTLRVRGLIALDDYASNSKTGRFVLLEDYYPVGGGIISMDGIPDQRSEVKVKSTNIHEVDYHITTAQRSYLNGHKGGVLWFSGLSGSGKTTLAQELQRHLFAKGYQVYVLDGDNIRSGLCSDLGFSPADRQENIRRIGEVAALFASAGVIVITAFISPYRSDRFKAQAAAQGNFHSIYVKADIKTCELRDPKGLYKKARAGEIKDFTGISAPYEEPEDPDLTINTTKTSVESCVTMLLDYVEQNLVTPVTSHSDKPSDYVGAEI